MTLEELQEQLQLDETQVELVKKFKQSTEDRIRSDYSAKLKDAETKLKELTPIELTEEQKEIEALKKELETTKFNNALKDLGVSNDMAKYLKSDIDLDEFKKFYDSIKTAPSDFVPNDSNINLGGGITKEQFSKMSIAERTELYNTNAELYEQLTQK